MLEDASAESSGAAPPSTTPNSKWIESPMQYILSERRFRSLNEIEQHLHKSLSSEQRGLITVLNEHFTDFINLSKDMKSVEEKLNLVESPVKQSRTLLKEMREGVTHWKHEIQQICHEAANLRMAHHTIVLFLNCYVNLQQLAHEITMIHQPKQVGILATLKYLVEANKYVHVPSKGGKFLKDDIFKRKEPKLTFFNEISDILDNPHEDVQILNEALSTLYSSETSAPRSFDDVDNSLTMLSIDSDRFIMRYLVYLNACIELHRLEMTLSGMKSVELDRNITMGGGVDDTYLDAPAEASLNCMLNEIKAFQSSICTRTSIELTALLTLLTFAFNAQISQQQIQASSDEGELPNTPSDGSDSIKPHPVVADRCETLCLAISYICKGLIALEDVSIVEDVFCKVFVLPAIELGLKRASDDTKFSVSISKGEKASISQFLLSISRTLLSDDCVLNWLLNRISSTANTMFMATSIPGLRLYSNVIGKLVFQAVEENYISVFLPVDLQEFSINYTSMKRFVNELTKRMKDSELSAWNESLEVQEFSKKWKTQIYFSMIRSNKLNSLEKYWIPSSSFKEKYFVENEVFYLKASAGVLKTILDIFNQNNFLDACYSAAIRLVAELFSKYTEYLRSVFSRIIREASTTEAESLSAAKSIPYYHLGYVLSDALLLLKWLKTKPPVDAYDSQSSHYINGSLAFYIISPMKECGYTEFYIQTPDEVPISAIQHLDVLLDEMLSEIYTALEEVVTEMRKWLIQCIVEDVSQQFIALRSIPKMYILTRREIPQKASSYVDGIMLCINTTYQFLRPIVPDEPLNEWMIDTVNRISLYYLDEIESLLQTVKLEQHSLKRLQKADKLILNQQVDAMRDFDKILLQIKLDTQRFAECCINDLEITGEALPCLEELKSSVEKFCEDIIYPPK